MTNGIFRWLTVSVLLVAPATAAGDEKDEKIAELRQEVAAVRSELEGKIEMLEARLRELERHTDAAPAVRGRDAELEDLRAAAGAEARQAEAELADAGEADQPAAPTVGRERNLNRLNPEISMTGIVEALSGDGEQDFQATEFELDLQAALDPFSRTRWTLAFSEEEGVEVEEGYIQYSGLPSGLDLKVGKFRQRFGPLNQQHLHALPQTTYPLPLTTYFGEEGLAQTGIGLAWVLPRGWATANELIVEVTDGEAEAFGGEAFDRVVGLARLKSFWEVSDSTYFEWGLSAVNGEAEGDLDTTILGTDFTWQWRPPARAKYREITWRAELLRSERDDPATGLGVEAWGGYSYLEGLIDRNWYLGLRYDRVEDPLAPGEDTWGWFPYLTWWQSEYVRLRAQYGLIEGPEGGSDDQLSLQVTWAAGPHKHETY